jgi:hypothetical protein
MNAKMEHSRVSSNAQDRTKHPGVFRAGLKSIGLTPGAVLGRSNLPLTVYGGDTFMAPGSKLPRS